MQLNDYKAAAITSWYIACKWDLIEYPAIKEVLDLTKIGTLHSFYAMETEILNTMDFYLGAPTPIVFLRPLSVIRQVGHSLFVVG